MTWFKHPLYRFLISAAAIFILWDLVYEGYLHPKGEIDKAVISNIINLSSRLIDLLGFAVVPEQPFDENYRTLAIDGGFSVWIGDPCNGLTLFALFTGFIISFPGPIKHKLWYIPVGLLAIHFINILRVTALAFMAKYYPDYLEFNHTYTFTIIVYSFVFVLWMVWARYFFNPAVPTNE